MGKGTVHPCNGGCWYCHRVSSEMDFCTEFDTWLHRSCVQERLDDSGAEPDPELAIIAAELGMTPGSDNNDTGTSSSSPE